MVSLSDSPYLSLIYSVASPCCFYRSRCILSVIWAAPYARLHATFLHLPPTKQRPRPSVHTYVREQHVHLVHLCVWQALLIIYLLYIIYYLALQTLTQIQFFWYQFVHDHLEPFTTHVSHIESLCSFKPLPSNCFSSSLFVLILFCTVQVTLDSCRHGLRVSSGIFMPPAYVFIIKYQIN
jgi:hypothetical protein